MVHSASIGGEGYADYVQRGTTKCNYAGLFVHILLMNLTEKILSPRYANVLKQARWGILVETETQKLHRPMPFVKKTPFTPSLMFPLCAKDVMNISHDDFLFQPLHATTDHHRGNHTGNGNVPAHAAISFFMSLIALTSPPATLALKSFSLFASLGNSFCTSLQIVMH